MNEFLKKMKEIERELEDQFLTKQDEKIAKLIENSDKISELYQNTQEEIRQHVQEKVRLRKEIAELKLQLNPAIVQVKVLSKDDIEYQKKVELIKELLDLQSTRDNLFFIFTKYNTELTEIDKKYFEQFPNEILIKFKEMVTEILDEQFKSLLKPLFQKEEKSK